MLGPIRKKLGKAKTEIAEKKVVTDALRARGHRKNPEVVSGKTPENLVVRMYVWRGTPLGDLCLVAGPSVEPELLELGEAPPGTKPQGVYIPARNGHPALTVLADRDTRSSRPQKNTGSKKAKVIPQVPAMRGMGPLGMSPPEESPTVPRPFASEDEIPMSLAVQAFSGTSHLPERRADYIRSEFAETMNELHDEWMGRAKTPEQRAVVEESLKDTKRRYRQAYVAWLQSRSGLMSPMVTGPARFPVERMRKKGDISDRKGQDTEEVLEKGKKLVRRALRAQVVKEAGGPIAWERKNLEAAESLQAVMRATNKIIRRKRGSIEDKIPELLELGLSEGVARKLFEPDFGGRTGFASYQLTNNNALIKRIKEKIAKLEAAETQQEAEEEHGVTTYEDPEGQVVLYHSVEDGTVAKGETRAVKDTLKKWGFRWYRKGGFWFLPRSRGKPRSSIDLEKLGTELGLGVEAPEPGPSSTPVEGPETEPPPEIDLGKAAPWGRAYSFRLESEPGLSKEVAPESDEAAPESPRQQVLFNPHRTATAEKRIKKAIRKIPREKGQHPAEGLCYPASEAFFHAVGGKQAGFIPMQLEHEGVSHWWVEGPGGEVHDLTAGQFSSPVPYGKSRGRGFLTKDPSERARVLMRDAGLRRPNTAYNYGDAPDEEYAESHLAIIDLLINAIMSIELELERGYDPSGHRIIPFMRELLAQDIAEYRDMLTVHTYELAAFVGHEQAGKEVEAVRQRIEALKGTLSGAHYFAHGAQIPLIENPRATVGKVRKDKEGRKYVLWRPVLPDGSRPRIYLSAEDPKDAELVEVMEAADELVHAKKVIERRQKKARKAGQRVDWKKRKRPKDPRFQAPFNPPGPSRKGGPNFRLGGERVPGYL